MTTIRPAQVIGRIEGHGTLRVGAPGDVAILQLVEEPTRFSDTKGNAREGAMQLRPAQTVVGGVAFGPPYAQPFAVR